MTDSETNENLDSPIGDRSVGPSSPMEIPMHLRPQPYPSPDEDCDDMQKIVVTPVYRGRLEESHERTRRAWRRRPWYAVTYSRFTRDAQAYVENNGQMIFAVLTYITGALMVLILLGIAIRSVIAARKPVHNIRTSANKQSVVEKISAVVPA